MANARVELPFHAYKGEKPFIFVSYAHADSATVYPDIKCLNDQGYRIWYDEGIEATKRWAEVIEEHLKRCTLFMVFISPAAVESDNVRDEIDLALDIRTQVLGVFIEETELRKGLRLRFGPKQQILRFRYELAEYQERLQQGLPDSLRENPRYYPEGSAEDDFAREIQVQVTANHGWADHLASPLLEFGQLLGLSPDRAQEVLKETRGRLGFDESYAENVRRLGDLVRHFLKDGDLAPERRQTVMNRAQAWHISPEQAEKLIQQEAEARARELREQGKLQESERVLVSAVGEHVPQSPKVRELLEELDAERKIRQPPAGAPLPGLNVLEAAAPAPPEAERARTLIADGSELLWARVPEGMFLRGCPEEFIQYIRTTYHTDASVFATYPVRKEPLAAFWLCLTPITNAQFLAFVKACGYRYPAGWRGTSPPYPRTDEHHPVTGVTWQDCTKFADWLGARLPTRAEYEKACRGTDGLLFPWGNQFAPEKCNTAEAERDHTTPVDAFPEGASPYHVLDLVGNVWEWAADAREESRMTVGASYKATGEIYGAGFFDVSRPPDRSQNDVGFRLACSDVRKLIVKELAFEDPATARPDQEPAKP